MPRLRFRMRLKTELNLRQAERRNQKLRREIRDALLEIAEGMKKDLNSGGLDEWFSHSGITFDIRVTFRLNNAYASVVTDSEKFNWFNKGTDIRWAVMNDPFSAQTTPGSLSAGGGVRTYNEAGEYTRIRGRTAMQAHNIAPRPGIVAREWTIIVVDIWKDKAAEILQSAVNRGLS